MYAPIRRATSTRRGATLFELLVALAIVGLVASLALSSGSSNVVAPTHSLPTVGSLAHACAFGDTASYDATGAPRASRWRRRARCLPGGYCWSLSQRDRVARALRWQALPRRGWILLDAVIALAISGLVAFASSTLYQSTQVSLARAKESASDVGRADRLLRAATLWTHDQLAARIGSRVQGEMLMTISPVSESLFVVAIHRASDGRLLLSTALYSPPPADEPRQ